MSLKNTLEKVINQKNDHTFTYEVIIIDDASTDVTEKVVKEFIYDSTVTVKYYYENGNGIANARNRGVKESLGEWIAFIDDDELPEHYWIQELYNVAKEKDADCVGGPMKLTLKGEADFKLGKIARMILGEKSYDNICRINNIRELPGSENILIKKDAFNKIGFFDSFMLRGGSDFDLVRRIMDAGLKIWSSPNAVVYHVISERRLNKDYFKMVSFRLGDNFAYIDFKKNGKLYIIMVCIARILKASLIDFPRIVLNFVNKDTAKLIDNKCLLWRMIGYSRNTLFLVFPIIFSQKKYFKKLEYRK